ncbi:MAG: redoxin domain-containing protein [Gemmatimonadota bacterium]|nr:redoxin domain-containing protein [Gemmatimonadota bacterium]
MTNPTTATALAVGAAAPDFTLASTRGTPFTLSSLRGEKAALLCFFPLAFTSTCTAEMCELSEDFDRFTSGNVEVFGISVDSVATLREFKAKHAMKVDFLSDFKRVVTRKYDLLIEEKFYSKRAYYLIDKSGTVVWMHIEEHPGLRRPTGELLAAIEQLPE